MSVPTATTKHFQVTHILRDEIRQMTPGTVLPTLDELKSRFQMSQATLDKALAKLRREGLIYRPDGQRRLVVSSVSDPAKRRISIVRPDYPSAVFDEIVRATLAAGKPRDWAFDIVHYRTIEKLELSLAMEDADAGLLLTTTGSLPRHLVSALSRPTRPVVVAQDSLDAIPVSTVCTDEQRVAEIAVEHLVSLGHRRIVMVVPSIQSGPMREIVRAWRMSLERIGQTDVDELLVDAQVPTGEYSLTWTYDALVKWIQNDPPQFTAMIGATSEAAMAISRVCLENGRRIPEDVSVVGSSGISVIGAFLNPPLTSIHFDMAQYGLMLVEQLEEHLNDPDAPPRKVKIQPSLVVRKSSAGVSPVRADFGMSRTGSAPLAQGCAADSL